MRGPRTDGIGRGAISQRVKASENGIVNQLAVVLMVVRTSTTTGSADEIPVAFNLDAYT